MSQQVEPEQQTIGDDHHDDHEGDDSCTFLHKLPREIRDKVRVSRAGYKCLPSLPFHQIYEFVLQVQSATTFKDGAIMRVNHQVHDEASGIFLKQNCFVLVSFHALQSVAKQLTQGGDCIEAVVQTGAEGTVTAFKHYNMRIVIRDPKDKKRQGRSSKRVHLLLLGLQLRTLCLAVARVQSHSANVDKISPSRLSYEIVIDAHSGSRLKEESLESQLMNTLIFFWWDFPHVTMTGAEDSESVREVLRMVRGKRWEDIDDVFNELNSLIEDANDCDDVSESFALLGTVDDIYDVAHCQSRYKPWMKSAQWKNGHRSLLYNLYRARGGAYMKLGEDIDGTTISDESRIKCGEKAVSFLKVAWDICRDFTDMSDGERGGLLNMLGCAYTYQMDAAEALRHFTLANQYDPGNPFILRNMDIFKTVGLKSMPEKLKKLGLNGADNGFGQE